MPSGIERILIILLASIIIMFMMMVLKARGRPAVDSVQLIARTLYFECGQQSLAGKRAVASVICNRRNRTDGTWASVILKRKQFSCWNDADKLNELPHNTNAYICLSLAKSMVNESFQPIGPWDHYYNPLLCAPSWGDKLVERQMIGDHRFGVLM
jgi:spore germination cell wall hydrolase CwlJ-like protein